MIVAARARALMEIKINPARSNKSRVYAPQFPEFPLSPPAHEPFFGAVVEDVRIVICDDVKINV